MEFRDLDSFYSDFDSYEGCAPPGVRLPKIEIESRHYNILGLSKESTSNKLFLAKLCDFMMAKKNIFDFKNFEDYKSRLNIELSIIDELGFTDYILLNWEIINFCKESNIPTGPGRGSAAGSLILFLLDVTKVDPIKYDLFFERFVSKSRARKINQDGVTYLDGSLLADVDNDIAYEHRYKVVDYIEKKYPGRTAKILTLNTLSSKLCIKECCKIVGGFSEQDANIVSDLIPKEFGIVSKLVDVIDINEKFKSFSKDNELVYNISLCLEGLKKNTGVHPSGIAISFDEIQKICPVQKTNDGSIVTSYDMNWVSELMVKFDILGLRTLSVIHNTCALLKIDPTEIDLSSEKIYNNFKELNHPHGLFQIEASANFSVCKKIKPRNLEELSAVIAIARPGAMGFSDFYAKYIETGISQSVDPFFDDVLSYTAGLPLYQEQLMKMAVKVGFTLDEAEQLRRIVGKKKVDQMPKWKSKIEEKVKENALDKNVADILWKVAEDSSNYSFNKSHSISYAILSAWTCFLKFNYPQEFFLSLLSMTEYEPSPQEEINIISQELNFFDINLLPPDIKKSKTFFSIEGSDIRYGLNSIKGVNQKSIHALQDFISTETSNKYDVFVAAKQAHLNIGVLASLIQAGMLQSFNTNRTRLVLEAQVFNLLTDREKRIFIQIGPKYNFDILQSIHDAVTHQTLADDGKPIMKQDRFETLKSKYINYKKIYTQNKNYENFANWFFEKNLLGFSYSSKLSDCFNEKFKLCNYLDFTSCEINDKQKYIGVVEDVFTRKSKKGNDYMKLLISDEFGRYDAILVDGRDKNLSKFKSKKQKLNKNSIVVLSGSKGEDILFLDEISVIDEKIYMKLADTK